MERNIILDYFKIILSLLVITIHTQSLFDEDSVYGWLISNGIARIAVPCFFIISGYFINKKLEDKQVLKEYLLHILLVYIIWSLIYLPTYYNTIEPRSLITFALMGYYHLWFLPALIIGIIMLAVVEKIFQNNLFVLLSGIILFVAGYIMENADMPYRSFCNGIFFGYPFLALGWYIRKKDLIKNIPNIYLYPLILISLCTLIIESYCGYKNEFYHNLFISLMVLCPVLFMLILKNSKSISKGNSAGKLSAAIYYVHILVITLIIPVSDSNNIYKLPLIMIVSILLAIFIVGINKRIKIFL
ncbi:acyltransferase [Prevotella sp. 10(H)]|uniref:acyltransferase n=1 Tax=Prevotella sp. 10(H) TaxID=1158294 RepID=UPI0004A6F3CB|nr:acyltransferase [Prevotella sp. 10(H)]